MQLFLLTNNEISTFLVSSVLIFWLGCTPGAMWDAPDREDYPKGNIKTYVSKTDCRKEVQEAEAYNLIK